MAEEMSGLPHKLTLDERTKLTLTGAKAVVHFDEETVQLETSQGDVIVHGEGLKLRTLSLEGGTVAITGKIYGVVYEEPRAKRGLGRFFG